MKFSPRLLHRFRMCLFLSVGSTCMASTLMAQAPETLPRWQEGFLEIHQISTGRGNATFFIFPDSTTLLLDAGAVERGIPEAGPRPDGSRSPGDWIARYIERVQPKDQTGIDYAVITHFHGDHMGSGHDEERPFDVSNSYRLSGITEVGTRHRIDKLIDRGWPDYDYPTSLDHENHTNYLHFIEHQKARGMDVERFRVGATDQLVLKHRPDVYPNFEIRNLTANGTFWSGEGTRTEERFPPLDSLAKEDWPSENMCSLSFRLNYGLFDYFTGGDLSGFPNTGHPNWQNMEAAVGETVGEVDVHLVSHHGSIDPATPAFLKALRPRVHIVPAWSPTHPAPSVLKRLMAERAYASERDVFITTFRRSTQETIGRRATRVAGTGHILVRVEPGGESYSVWTLDDSDERFAVTSRHGPYVSR